eukprot:6074244-Prymnesium_polylepis.3
MSQTKSVCAEGDAKAQCKRAACERTGLPSKLSRGSSERAWYERSGPSAPSVNGRLEDRLEARAGAGARKIASPTTESSSHRHWPVASGCGSGSESQSR